LSWSGGIVIVVRPAFGGFPLAVLELAFAVQYPALGLATGLAAVLSRAAARPWEGFVTARTIAKIFRNVAAA
jgi:hypothetical protein